MDIPDGDPPPPDLGTVLNTLQQNTLAATCKITPKLKDSGNYIRWKREMQLYLRGGKNVTSGHCVRKIITKEREKTEGTNVTGKKYVTKGTGGRKVSI